MFRQFPIWVLYFSISLSSTAWSEEVIAPSANLDTAATATSNAFTPLTLDEAVAMALANSPRLMSAVAAILARQAEHQQTGLLPNPELAVEAEDFAGRGAYQGLNSAEITYGVTQLVEIGGKRSSREAVSEQRVRLSEQDYKAEYLNVIRDVTIAYVETVAAQEELKLAKEQQKLTEDLLKEVNVRVNAAREPLIQRSKAEIMVSTATLDQARAEREFKHTQHVLASMLGGHHETYTLDRESFFAVTPPNSEAEVEAALAANPNLKRREAEYARSEALLELEKAQGVPDPRINLGLRDYRESDSQALVAGISIPIPVFNRNQGSIERARQEVAKAKSDAAATKIMVQNEAFQVLEEMINAHAQAESLKTSILPAAEKAFRLSREGYRAGKFAYLEVLDSQRTLFEARAQYIAALKDYHKARAQVERFTARHAATATHEEPYE
jgi:outer membrane protein, heavy metal efflux system